VATTDLSGAHERTSTTGRPTRTPNWHYASMRCAEDAARSISVRRSVGSVPAGELEAAKAVQASFYLLAAAHRRAAHRLERGERIRARVERVVRLVTRGGFRAVRAAVTR